MKSGRKYYIIFATVLFCIISSCNNKTIEEEKQYLLSKARKSLLQNDSKKFNKIINKLYSKHVVISKEDLFTLFNSNFENISYISKDNAMYLASFLEIDKSRTCICSLYRYAIDDIFQNNRVTKILNNDLLYKTSMIILLRSLTNCNDNRSLILRSILSTGKKLNFNSISLIDDSSDIFSNPNIFLLSGISAWLRKDFSTATKFFNLAEVKGKKLYNYNTFNKQSSQINKFKWISLPTTKAEKELKRLKKLLNKYVKIKHNSFESLTSYDLLDIVEKIKINKIVSTTAKRIGIILDIIDIINLIDSTLKTIELNKSVSVLERKTLSIKGFYTKQFDSNQIKNIKPSVNYEDLQKIANTIVNSCTSSKLILLKGCCSNE